MQWRIVGVGAGLGAILRAWLARFNPLHAWLPFGTLSANVLGGLLMGVALAFNRQIKSSVKRIFDDGVFGWIDEF